MFVVVPAVEVADKRGGLSTRRPLAVKDTGLLAVSAAQRPVEPELLPSTGEAVKATALRLDSSERLREQVVAVLQVSSMRL